ncbi:AAA family ATPase [Pedobacter nanyangensis]|uniref:AAA family ATPase n=1 Tax=Pedobacter nanyangensis TaxID=1562389 RepID=UPI000DE4E2F7|nr:AAA family ATPase [Pedobacter nanyangensis]
MELRKLEITNFRGIKHLEIDDLKLVNVFLGKNNAGKTSILEAIFISLGSQNPRIPVILDNFRNLLHTEADDFRFLFYELNYNNEVNIKTYYDDIEKGLIITPNSSKVYNSNSQTQLIEKLNSSSTTTDYDKIPISGLKLTYDLKKKHAKRETSAATIELEALNQYRLTPSKTPEVNKGIIVTGNTQMTSLVPKLDRLIVNKQENKVIDVLKLVDSSIKGITLGANGIILCDTGFGKRYPLNLLGEGVIKLLAILLAILDADGGVVLIDEFSNGLHFTALKNLWKAILLSATEKNVQVFLTTHHYESLEYLQQVLQEDDFVKFQNEIRSYTIRKLPDCNLKSYIYDYDKLNNAIQQEVEIR